MTAAAPPGREPVWVTGVGVVAARAVGGSAAVRGLRAALAARPAAAGDLPLDGVDFAALLGARGLRHLTRGTLALLGATRLALADAAPPEGALGDPDGAGVAVGTATATAGLVAEFDRTVLAEGPQAANPAVFPQTVWNGPACQAAIRHGLRGPNLTLSTGLNSGLDAVLAAARLIRRGRARAVVAAGFEELTPYFRVLFEAGAGPPPPLAEGAAALVLEAPAAARARGARALATIEGGASEFAPPPSDDRERLQTLVGRIGAGGLPAWCLGPRALEGARAAETRDLWAAAGCGGGLSGALAAALAAVGGSGPELVAAADGDGRVAALVLGPAP